MTAAHNNQIRVLIVDDNLTILWGLGKLIQGEWPRMSLLGKAHTAAEALLLAHARPDVIVIDLDFDGHSSIEILPTLLARSGGRVLVYTALLDQRLHDDAMLLGAAGVLHKGEPADRLVRAIAHVHASESWTPRPESVDAVRMNDKAGDWAHCHIASLTPAERQTVVTLVRHFRVDAGTHCPLLLDDVPPVEEIASIYSKLGLRNRAELYAFATRHGLAHAGD